MLLVYWWEDRGSLPNVRQTMEPQLWQALQHGQSAVISAVFLSARGLVGASDVRKKEELPELPDVFFRNSWGLKNLIVGTLWLWSGWLLLLLLWFPAGHWQTATKLFGISCLITTCICALLGTSACSFRVDRHEHPTKSRRSVPTLNNPKWNQSPSRKLSVNHFRKNNWCWPNCWVNHWVFLQNCLKRFQ